MTAALLDFPRSCGPCQKGRHEACVLISCTCKTTEACERNARLTLERERRP